jgi:hypothetical protein
MKTCTKDHLGRGVCVCGGCQTFGGGCIILLCFATYTEEFVLVKPIRGTIAQLKETCSLI